MGRGPYMDRVLSRNQYEEGAIDVRCFLLCGCGVKACEVSPAGVLERWSVETCEV
jgi:hypothetical protein